MSTPTKNSPFMRFASAVADFGDPFYAEERQRDVWNEASAFGFQLLLWGSLVLATAMLWFGGPAALPYAVAMIILAGMGSAMTIGYAHRLGVEVASKTAVSRSRQRLVLLALLVAALVLGLVRAALLGESSPGSTGLTMNWSTAAGLITGLAVAIVPVLLTARWIRRRDARADHPGEGLE